MLPIIFIFCYVTIPYEDVLIKQVSSTHVLCKSRNNDNSKTVPLLSNTLSRLSDMRITQR